MSKSLNVAKLKSPFAPNANVVAYARDSGGEEQDRSCDQQLQLYAAYCQHHNLNLIKTFTDRAKAGSSVIGRDGFESMIAYLRENAPLKTKRRAPQQNGVVDGVILWKINRFARNLNESQFYKADLRRRGLQLVFLADDLPDMGELTPIFETVLEWKAQRDLHDISTDAKRGLASLVTAKKPNGDYEGFAPGKPPTCYTRQQVKLGVKRNGAPRLVSRWVPDAKTWSRGKKAWQMRAAGQSISAIHQATKLFGAHNSYTTFFRNEIYLGIFKFGDLILENFVPPLCTKNEWARVQAQLSPRPQRDGAWTPTHHPKQKSANSYILSGLLICGECGSQMIGNVGSKSRGRAPWRFYICSQKQRGIKPCKSARLSAATAEHTLTEALAQNVFTPENLTAQFAHFRQYLASEQRAAPEQIAAWQKELTATKRALANLTKLVEQGDTSATIANQIKLREAEQREIETKLITLAKTPDPKKVLDPTPAQIAALQQRLTEALTSGDPQRVKALLRAYIISATVTEAGVHVKYRLPLKQTTPNGVGGGGFSASTIALDTGDAPTGTYYISSVIIISLTKPRHVSARNVAIIAQRKKGKLLRELAIEHHLSLARIEQIYKSNATTKLS